MATMLGLAMGRYFPMDGFLWLVGGGWWGFGPVKIKVHWQKFIYGSEKPLFKQVPWCGRHSLLNYCK